MNIKHHSFRLTALLAVSVALLVSSCGQNEEPAPSPSPSATAKVSPSATPKASPSASPSPGATSSPGATKPSTEPEAKLPVPPEAQKLGVKPKDATTCPPDALIKGKVTKKRGNIYHAAKTPDYEKTKPDICFKDVATAEKAGFRAPKQQ